MRIRFTEDVCYETEGPGKGPSYRAGSSHDLSEDQAQRWLRRGVAEIDDGKKAPEPEPQPEEPEAPTSAEIEPAAEAEAVEPAEEEQPEPAPSPTRPKRRSPRRRKR